MFLCSSVRLLSRVGLSAPRRFDLSSPSRGMGVARSRMMSSISDDTGATKANVDPNLLAKARSTPEKMSSSEWEEVLTPIQYEVSRNSGTERAFTGHLWDNKEKGSYVCVGCSTTLFDSAHKYDSGSGWPSFYDTVSKDNVETKKDVSLGMMRIEALCKKCRGHLGHVFTDGPEPTGLRYCINSASLKFKSSSEN